MSDGLHDVHGHCSQMVSGKHFAFTIKMCALSIGITVKFSINKCWTMWLQHDKTCFKLCFLVMFQHNKKNCWVDTESVSIPLYVKCAVTVAGLAPSVTPTGRLVCSLPPCLETICCLKSYKTIMLLLLLHHLSSALPFLLLPCSCLFYPSLAFLYFLHPQCSLISKGRHWRKGSTKTSPGPPTGFFFNFFLALILNY